MRTMEKKRLCTTVLLAGLLFCSLQAQPREMMGGVQIGYANQIYFGNNDNIANSSIALGGRFHYELYNQLLLAPEVNFCLGEKGDTWWTADLSVNLHYNFIAAIDFCIYPIAGVSYSHLGKGKYFPSGNQVGANMGIGAQYNLNSNLTLNAEYKYQIYRKRDVMNFALVLGYRF